ncbi:MAG: NADH-quinone oxidoreductase subunit J [Syntrophaceae bacterium PtaB.Bin038]|nr:MAG: NADH-quinone oxidoreductase subunit J [Syntrophaceae bacterium PtaB.Bin038]
MIETILFWVLAAAAVASALGVVALRNPVGSVMALLAAMLATAGLYALMGAVVPALFQVIVYIGAVLVLFLFVVMLLDLRAPAAPARPAARAAVAGAAGVGLTAAAAWGAWKSFSHASPAGGLRPAPGVAEIALDLFGRHLLVFELTSVLLLAAAVGAIFISRTKKRRPS